MRTPVFTSLFASMVFLAAAPALAGDPKSKPTTSGTSPTSGKTTPTSPARPTPTPPSQGTPSATGQPAMGDTKQLAAPRDDRSFAMHMAQHHRQGIELATLVIANGASDEVEAKAKRMKAEQEKELAELEARIGNMPSSSAGAQQGAASQQGQGMTAQASQQDQGMTAQAGTRSQPGTAAQPGARTPQTSPTSGAAQSPVAQRGTSTRPGMGAQSGTGVQKRMGAQPGSGSPHAMGPQGGTGMHGMMGARDPDLEQGLAKLRTAKGAEADRLFLELMIMHHASALMMSQAAMDHLTDTQLKAKADQLFAKQAREIGELQRLREGPRAARR